jgi:elongation factor P
LKKLPVYYRITDSEHKTKEDNKMISAGDFRNGVTIEIEGNVCQIVEFQHVKPGKGAAFVRTKYKNIITGAVLEKSFRPTEKFPQARIDRVDMSYLYNDGDLYNFMNTETYDQVALTKEQVGDSLKFVKENEVVKVCSWNGNVYAIEPPLFVELEVIETEPGFAGNTAQGATKPATVETGAQVMVPLFVNQGDKLKIDTRTGEYLSRV